MIYKPILDKRVDIYTKDGVYKGYFYKMFDEGWWVNVQLLTKVQAAEVLRKQTELNALMGIILTAE